MLEQRRAQEKGYITLKEAAEISNYSADYIGQLIRAGKIEGQQVYSNVAWVTTEDSIQSYMNAKNKKEHVTVDESGNITETVQNFGLYLWYTVVIFLVLTCLFLFYVFSVSFDKFLTEQFSTQQAAPNEAELFVIHE